MSSVDAELLPTVFDRLKKTFGYQGWWPLGSHAGTPGHDSEGYRTRPAKTASLAPADRIEIAIGAVLTQNTSWENARRALVALRERRLMDRRAITGREVGEVAQVIRPSGYFNQKARKILLAIDFLDPWLTVESPDAPPRDELLGVWGIGPETADSILLYAFDVALFVVDAYARRVLSRVGLVQEAWSYTRIQQVVHESLPPDPERYGELHALFVRHGQTFCRRREPRCEICPLHSWCSYAGGSPES